MTLRFRQATADDVSVVVSLVESAFRGDASRAGWTTEAELLDGQRTDAVEVRAKITDPAGRFVLAHDGDALVGCVCITVEHGSAHVGMVSVSPGRQAGGLGRALLAEAERVGRSLGCTHGDMTVIRQRAELIAWYERRGWARTGESAPFPYGDERFGRPRRDDLVFDVLRKRLDTPTG